jgi:membrane peptidoglycan carboxypeptidase
VNRRSASPLTIVRQRRHRRDGTRHSARQQTQRLAFGFGTIVSAAAVVLVLAAALTYASLTRDLPPVEELEAQLNPSSGLMLQPTRLYDRTGQHLLATLAPTDAVRVYIPYNQFPQSFVNATLALTQPDFWDSPGYVTGGWQDTDSHPTLAQQLAFELLLADKSSAPLRGIHERLLAAQITARYGREQVIEWYLNTAEYGHFAYGAEAASQLYFGKSVTQLTLSESALLAAVGQAPGLNPLDAPQAAETGRVETLRSMLALGWVTPAEANEAVNAAPLIAEGQTAIDAKGISQQFIELILRQLDAAIGTGRVERGGVIIYTSLDYNLQLQTDCTLRTQLARLADDSASVSAVDGSPCTMAELLPAAQAGDASTQAVAGAVILDPATGQILAAAGDLTSHPAGTAFTPFLYLTGFARGLNPASLGWDLPGEAPVLGQVYQGPVRLRIALVNDYLPPAHTILGQIGAENMRATATSFGLKFPSAGLLETDFGISPFDLAFAYATLASQGLQSGQSAAGADPEPVAVIRVTGADGSIWLDWSSPQTRLVVSPQLAYLMNHVLSDETARQLSLGHPNPLEIGRPAAAKTSHTLDGTGAWVTGYTPQRTVIVYLAGTGSGSQTAANELWGTLTQYAVRDLPPTGWDMPSGIVTLKVCDPSGLLPTDACPNVVSEVFLDGSQPMQTDTLYQTFKVNIETGLLATIFTPPDFVVERVYMVVPLQARAWAETAGIVAPPSTYDTLQMPAVLPDAHITTPAMFADGGGVLTIRGTAAGADFVSYRLEYGAGLNPQRWLLLGSDVTIPVTEGLLASWDTAGLDGLYALRLMVLRSDNRVEQAIVQVTLDNTPPEIAIQYPQAGQGLSLAQEPQIALQAQVQDAFLAEVVFYMDGEKVGNISTAPFGILWQAEKGEHILRITAKDRAGNVGETEIKFTVLK